MFKPSHVLVDESQRYAFIKDVDDKPITYVRLEDVYKALKAAEVGYSAMASDELDAKIELFEHLKTKGW